jgi:proline iminopeptidase
MHSLYPPLEAADSFFLETDSLHRVYVEECGNAAGLPTIFLHGGPGSSCKAYHRQFFDPARYRAILFDQRGCGRSTPHGAVERNDTQALIDDMEAIRTRLGVERWLVFGGSWGATLALAYAESHPERVSGLILRASFLARQCDVDWFFKEGVNRIFPDYWSELLESFTPEEQADLVAACYRRMQGADEVRRLSTARAWAAWTGRVVTYLLSPGSQAQAPAPAPGSEEAARLIGEVAIETHYAWHHYFLRPDQLLRESDRLPRVPITIIHGRRDMTCTLEASWALHQRRPDARFEIVPEAGHLASEPAMIDALVRATDEMAARLA